MLKIGDQAPDIASVDQNGASIHLAELLREGPVLLYFYPADFTPICTAQARAFQNQAGALEEFSIRIIGISPQSPDSHRRFASTYNLEFPLVSDERKSIIRSYGVDGPLGFGVRRATFLIDQSAAITNRVVSDLFVGSHTDFIRTALADAGAAG